MPVPTGIGQPPPAGLAGTHDVSVALPSGGFGWPQLPLSSGPVTGQLIDPAFDANAATAWPTTGYDLNDYLVISTAGTIGADNPALGERWRYNGTTFEKIVEAPTVAAEYDTYADLRGETTQLGSFYSVRGGQTVGDGSAGIYEDIGTDAKTDDGGHILRTAGGRTLRRVGAIEPKFFGATPFASDSTGAAFLAAPDDSLPLQAWADAHANEGAELHIDGREQYRANSAINFSSRKPEINLNGMIMAPKQRTQIAVLRDSRPADAALEGTLEHTIRVNRFAGASRTDPHWTSYDYANNPDEVAVNGGGQTEQTTLWTETDIGVHCIAIKNSKVTVEARGCAIACCVDTDPAQSTATNGGGYCSRSKFEHTAIYQCKVGFLVRSRDQGGDNGWVNEVVLGSDTANIECTALTGASTAARYGFVTMGDPAVAQTARHVPDGIRIAGSVENADHATSTTAAVWIVDGRGFNMRLRNDLPNYKMCIVNDELNNRNHTLNTSKRYGQDQVVNRSGGDFVWNVDGASEEKVTLLDGVNLRRKIHANDDTTWRAHGPFLAFQRSATTPDLMAPITQLRMEDEDHINNVFSGLHSSLIGGMVELGPVAGEGYIQVNVFKNDTPAATAGEMTVMCYDAAGAIMTPGAGWLVRDCTDSPGAMVPWTYLTYGHVGERTFQVLNERTYRLRFHSSVASAFIAVGGEMLSGFSLAAVSYPGCKIVRQGCECPVADQQPNHGSYLEAIEIYNSDPNAVEHGWRLRGTNFPLLGTHRWTAGITPVVGRIYHNNFYDAWECTTAAGVTDTEPTGTGPHTDGNGNVFAKRAEQAARWTLINEPVIDTVAGLPDPTSYPVGTAMRVTNDGTLADNRQWQVTGNAIGETGLAWE